MLDTAQLEELATAGITRITAAIPRTEAATIEDRIWDFFAERDGVVRDDPTTWTGNDAKLQGLRRARVFEPFLGPTLAAVSSQLVGEGWTTYDQHPQALVTFPFETDWDVPHQVWHFDLPARGPTDRLWTVRFLGFVSHVGTRGGGTLVVEGSPELVRRHVVASGGDAGQSADVRRHLAREHAWFRELSTPGGDRIRRFMDEGDEIEGVRVRVRELTGEPGDVVVMHPWMLHNISSNISQRPRMMMTHSAHAADSRFYAPREIR